MNYRSEGNDAASSRGTARGAMRFTRGFAESARNTRTRRRHPGFIKLSYSGV
jgi:hypothetical protein